jgi:cell division protein FtsQ
MTAPPIERPAEVDLGGPRRHRRRRALIAALALLVVAALVWVVWFSPLLQVRQTRVVGAEGMRAEEVLAAAAVPVGVPLARIDAGAAEARVRDLAWVSAVEVRRGWPSEVVVAVQVREPVAVLAGDPRRSGISADGVVFEATDLPKGLPRITAEGPALAAAVSVLTGLPEDLRRRVEAIAATTRDDIDLTLRSGDLVRWGSAEQGDMKAEVLRVLLTRRADLYDVSAPELPTTFRLG